jgi:hypothetical protein
MSTLFGGVAPAGAQFTDGSPGITVCTTFTFHEAGVGVAGQVTEVWWYCGANTGGTWTALGWEVTHNDVGGAGAGTLVANQAFVGTPTPNAWNKITLSSPVDIPADYNRRWRFGIHNPNNYWANNNFYETHDETSAPITAYRDDDTTSTLGKLSQGTFALGATLTTYPAQTGLKANYGIDVTFFAGGAPPEDHTSTGTALATATASATDSTVRVSSGTAAAGATASAAVSPLRPTTGTARATATAAASVTAAHTSAGTALAVATASNYTAGGTRGPRVVSRSSNRPRIVTRAQLAT